MDDMDLEPVQMKRKRYGLWVFCMAIIILFILCGIGYFFLSVQETAFSVESGSLAAAYYKDTQGVKIYRVSDQKAQVLDGKWIARYVAPDHALVHGFGLDGTSNQYILDIKTEHVEVKDLTGLAGPVIDILIDPSGSHMLVYGQGAALEDPKPYLCVGPIDSPTLESCRLVVDDILAEAVAQERHLYHAFWVNAADEPPALRIVEIGGPERTWLYLPTEESDALKEDSDTTDTTVLIQDSTSVRREAPVAPVKYIGPLAVVSTQEKQFVFVRRGSERIVPVDGRYALAILEAGGLDIIDMQTRTRQPFASEDVDVESVTSYLAPVFSQQ
ncbi:MAG: hypothetical protein COU35_05145 [Candidatus Magasanikbacteria bacterium CG10_big_fil_rev_8_21_14_0_10_47_10]|uniref:Uncharacterized protein n=1 Tax=Candidatus Magasanikbacteria bacterium CG10_big_fil_rev_8_21_14_0_10_47_10 TaxID=1974652 RepID=A0A2H0TP46_9BACT|nr:MAG: hypothetical protein COU35_05145 [Candidatus Magasanikbacteria bacterium CG10_big_fil_rev_8_21_14_0_10_47_10]